MEGLRPNEHGCCQFVEHPFKKEKCKSCGRPWQEHLGVISEEQLQGFLRVQREAEQRRQQQEDAAKEKARAKALAKRRQARAPEDDWLYDDAPGDAAGAAESEDEGGGFQMLEGGNLNAMEAVKKPSTAQEHRPLRIVNLIDFGECDVREERPAPPPATAPAAAPAERPAPPQSSPAPPPPLAAAWAPPPVPGRPASPEPTPTEEGLLAEIDELRQRLKDSDAERHVQVSIVRDEVLEKERVIQELTRQREEAEASLSQARQQLEALQAERAAAMAAAMAAASANGRCHGEAQPLRPNEAVAEEGGGEVSTQVSEEALEHVGPLSDRGNIVWKILDRRNWLRCIRPQGEE